MALFHGYTTIITIVLLATSNLVIFSEAGSSSSELSNAILIKVDQSGNGDYKTIQEAIDAVPSKNTQHVFILVKPGVYREKVVVPSDKPFITISGRKNTVKNTIITGNDYGDIFKSPTFTVFASDFVARYLTIQVHICLHLLTYYNMLVNLFYVVWPLKNSVCCVSDPSKVVCFWRI